MNKFWFQSLLTLLIIPLGLIFMLFFRSYARGKGGIVKRTGAGAKLTFGILWCAVWLIGIASTLPPSGRSPSQISASTASSALPACNSPDARAVLQNAVEQNAANNVQTLRLLDVREATEVSADEAERRCNATLVLNSGAEAVDYKLYWTSNADALLVEIGYRADRVRQSHHRFRLEHLPGGACTRWKAPPFHGARRKRSLFAKNSELLQVQWLN